MSEILLAYTEILGDRRSRRRFEINLPVRIKLLGRKSVTDIVGGTVLNLSSTGIAFETDELPQIGALVELSISWPILLHGKTPVKLVAQGTVVRTDGQLAAAAVVRYEFRTQGRR